MVRLSLGRKTWVCGLRPKFLAYSWPFTILYCMCSNRSLYQRCIWQTVRAWWCHHKIPIGTPVPLISQKKRNDKTTSSGGLSAPTSESLRMTSVWKFSYCCSCCCSCCSSWVGSCCGSCTGAVPLGVVVTEGMGCIRCCCCSESLRKTWKGARWDCSDGAVPKAGLLWVPKWPIPPQSGSTRFAAGWSQSAVASPSKSPVPLSSFTASCLKLVIQVCLELGFTFPQNAKRPYESRKTAIKENQWRQEQSSQQQQQQQQQQPQPQPQPQPQSKQKNNNDKSDKSSLPQGG